MRAISPESTRAPLLTGVPACEPADEHDEDEDEDEEHEGRPVMAGPAWSRWCAAWASSGGSCGRASPAASSNGLTGRAAAIGVPR